MVDPHWRDLERLVPDFWTELDLSPSTRRTYREALKTFFAWCGGNPAHLPEGRISASTVRIYKNWLQSERSANTASTYLVALRRCFADLKNQGRLESNPVESIKGPRKPHGHLRSDLTRAEIRAVLAAIDRSNPLGLRDFAMINLMVRCGLRLIEAQRANAGDIEAQQGRRILRIWGKGRDARDEFVVLTEPTERALAEYLATRGALQPSDPLFASVGKRKGGQRLSRRNIRRRVTLYMEKAGVKRPRISAHSLRHSFVTLAIEGGASILQAQTAARHRSVQTTLVYFHEHTRLKDPVEDRIEI